MKTKNFYALAFGLLLALVLAEIILRVAGTYDTYAEKRFGFYIDVINDYNPKNLYFNYPPNFEHHLESPEFSFLRKSNSHGFSDREFEKRTDSTEIRILCLGDSFTEGDGAPADSAYPAQLQALLNQQFPDRKINVFNAGTCGSDPVFGCSVYCGLKEVINPDIIIQSLSAQDMMEDIMSRGGFERFVNDSTVRFIKLRWGWLYKNLHLSRIYFNAISEYNEFFINSRVREERKPAIINTMKKIMHFWNDTLQPNQKIYFLLRPDVQEVKDKAFTGYFQSVLDSMMPVAGRVIFLNYNTWLTATYNISDEDIHKIFWTHDGHHNAAGYRLMAQCIADELIPVVETCRIIEPPTSSMPAIPH